MKHIIIALDIPLVLTIRRQHQLQDVGRGHGGVGPHRSDVVLGPADELCTQWTHHLTSQGNCVHPDPSQVSIRVRLHAGMEGCSHV